MTPAPTTDVRLTELLAALSIATDLGMGQPLEFALQSCVLALRLAERLGLDAATIGAIRQVYARWDGKGIPPLNGEAIAPGMLLVSLAQDTVYAYRLDGVDAAVALAQKRKGTLYAPKHVEVFVRHARTLFADLDADPSWAAVLALDPGRPRYLSDAELDAACAAIADFADIKAPFL
ncbi:MAG TPA: hypothetical protein VFU22_13740, partial [Roseiflexaceae bacterium]|nr:hypothetical protein [Roseiflexaceae bacterium]